MEENPNFKRVVKKRQRLSLEIHRNRNFWDRGFLRNMALENFHEPPYIYTCNQEFPALLSTTSTLILSPARTVHTPRFSSDKSRESRKSPRNLSHRDASSRHDINRRTYTTVNLLNKWRGRIEERRRHWLLNIKFASQDVQDWDVTRTTSTINPSFPTKSLNPCFGFLLCYNENSEFFGVRWLKTTLRAR